MVRALRVLAAAFAVAALSVSGSATASPTSTLDGTVRELVAAGSPGALAVVRTRSGVRRAAAGAARLHPRDAMRPTDRFRIASVTKPFVATVILQLAGAGKLRLGDAVERWVPGLVPNGRAITIRQLLSHTSGLFPYDEDTAWIRARLADPGRAWAARRLVRIAVSHPPQFDPGTSWSYSNTNYVLLGLIVEAATGRPLAAELRARIFAPLGLRSTSYPVGTAIDGRFAHGYVLGRPPLPIPAGTLADVSARLNPSAWGAGQMLSNADDVTAFLSALLAAMKQNVHGRGYGLGLFVVATSCGTAYGHDGDLVGWRNVVYGTGDGRRVTAVMVNIDTKVTWGELHAAADEVFCSR